MTESAQEIAERIERLRGHQTALQAAIGREEQELLAAAPPLAEAQAHYDAAHTALGQALGQLQAMEARVWKAISMSSARDHGAATTSAPAPPNPDSPEARTVAEARRLFADAESVLTQATARHSGAEQRLTEHRRLLGLAESTAGCWAWPRTTCVRPKRHSGNVAGRWPSGWLG